MHPAPEEPSYDTLREMQDTVGHLEISYSYEE